jgi:large subunit ribosomal protein L13
VSSVPGPGRFTWVPERRGSPRGGRAAVDTPQRFRYCIALRICLSQGLFRSVDGKGDAMSTPMPKQGEIQRSWFVVDAEGAVLGRLASRIATILRGKHKPLFAPHLDVGDHVIVVNAEKVHLTGRKRERKEYRWHTGYIGGLRTTTADKLLKTHPERVIEWAVQGMLPKNRLGRAMARKLKIYRGPDHPHAAQQPQSMTGR